jgi:hypothetical protein
MEVYGTKWNLREVKGAKRKKKELNRSLGKYREVKGSKGK